MSDLGLRRMGMWPGLGLGFKATTVCFGWDDVKKEVVGCCVVTWAWAKIAGGWNPAMSDRSTNMFIIQLVRSNCACALISTNGRKCFGVTMRAVQ